MKYAYAFLAALLLVGASAFPISFNDEDGEPNELDYEFLDFIKLIPEGELERVYRDHIDDPELLKVFQYVLSEDFHKLLYAAEDLPEFHKYVLYLQKVGYNAIRELKEAHKILGMKDYIPPKEPKEFMANMKKGGGLNGYVDDLIAILPKKEIKELHEQKLKESPAFAKFSAAVRSPVFSKIQIDLYFQRPMQNLLRNAKANGYDFEKLNNFKNQLLGFA